MDDSGRKTGVEPTDWDIGREMLAASTVAGTSAMVFADAGSVRSHVGQKCKNTLKEKVKHDIK